MDLTKSSFYQSLTDCEDNGTADAIFQAAVERDLDPLAVKMISSIGDGVGMTKLFINTIRACDYLGTEVPKVFTDALYDMVQRLSTDQLSSVIEELGENEIGLAIGRIKRLKLTRDSDILYDLQRRYARSVEIDVWLGHIFEKAEEVFFPQNANGSPVFANGWNNLRKITNVNIDMKVTLRDTLPNLEHVESYCLKIETDQPSLTVLKTNTYTSDGSIQIPSLRLLMRYWYDGGAITVLHPHLEISYLHHPEFTPNLKALFRNRTADVPDNVVTYDTCRHSGRTPTRTGTKFLNCRVTLEQHDERPLEFYSCTFEREGKNISVEQAKELLPNATFVMCGIHWG